MVIAERDVAYLIDEICLATLGMATHPLRPGDPSLVPGEPSLDGVINISGDCQATVALQVSRPLAMRMASVMFRLGSIPPTLEDMQDALGELTNMLGGNIKSLLEGECYLSLPAVIEGRAYTVAIPGAQVMTRVEFMCDGLPATIHLLTAGALPLSVH